MTFQEYRELVRNQKTDQEDCPIQKLMGIFSGKWTMTVIFELTREDTLRFGELKSRIPGITAAMLSSTLKDLERAGIVLRTQFDEIPPRVEYALSKKGKDLYPIFLEMARWAQKYV